MSSHVHAAALPAASPAAVKHKPNKFIIIHDADGHIGKRFIILHNQLLQWDSRVKNKVRELGKETEWMKLQASRITDALWKLMTESFLAHQSAERRIDSL